MRQMHPLHRSQATAMANGTSYAGAFTLLLLLAGALLGIQAAPTDLEAHSTTEQPAAESRAQQQDLDVLDVDDDLDGRSAYVNNQFVPNEPVELVDDEQNAPLYEILQKQMEQVLAATGPDVPIYEDDKSKRQRVQQAPNKPIFTNNNDADTDDEYADLAAPDSGQSYVDAEKPDAAAGEDLPETGYPGAQQISSSTKPTDNRVTQPPSSYSTVIRNRPQRRRTTTALPRTTRTKNSSTSKPTDTTPSLVNHTEVSTSTAAPAAPSHKPRPQTKPNPQYSLPHDPQIYQHKRRIIFKTISTGSQFVNSPIGDLMIKFSIGFAKPAPVSASGGAASSNEALRALSQNLLRNIELQKLKRINKLQKD